MSNNKSAGIFGIKIDCLTLMEASTALIRKSMLSDGFKYVVTPNADHIVNLRKDLEFYRSYTSASMVVADGWPVVLAARFLGFSIPERVAGSDLVPAILKESSDNGINLRVFVLGGLGNVPEIASANIQRKYPGVNVVGYMSPPIGFDINEAESILVVNEINNCNPDIVIIGLGSPKQEKWISKYANKLNRGVGICAGATVDFMAGNVRRSPQWMSRFGLEWLYRLIQEPRRMFYRYLRVSFVFPFIFVREAIIRYLR